MGRQPVDIGRRTSQPWIKALCQPLKFARIHASSDGVTSCTLPPFFNKHETLCVLHERHLFTFISHFLKNLRQFTPNLSCSCCLVCLANNVQPHVEEKTWCCPFNISRQGLAARQWNPRLSVRINGRMSSGSFFASNHQQTLEAQTCAVNDFALWYRRTILHDVPWASGLGQEIIFKKWQRSGPGKFLPPKSP